MQVHFTIASQFYVHVNVEFLYTRFLTFMLISTMVFIWWKIMVCDCISVMRDGVEHPTSFVEASQKKAKLNELSNNISDRSAIYYIIHDFLRAKRVSGAANNISERLTGRKPVRSKATSERVYSRICY